MEETYVPKAVKSGKFEGSLRLKLLSFDERFEQVVKSQAPGIDNTAFMRALVKEFAPRFAAVELTRKADGRKFSSISDLQYGVDCHGVLIDAVTWLLNGDTDEEGKTFGADSVNKLAPSTAG